MRKIAIVGSQGKYWMPYQRTEAIKKIKEILYRPRVMMGDKGFNETMVDDVMLISGGCGSLGEDVPQKFDGGIDVWAEIVADMLGIEKDIKYSQWYEKDSFERRNREIAEDCDELYCIDPECRTWSGGRWTMKMASDLGKPTQLIIVVTKSRGEPE